jgi:hypothetical protein
MALKPMNVDTNRTGHTMLPTELLPLIWSRLAGTDTPARGAFGLLYAASIDLQGAPTVRSIVLREVAAAEHRIRFYTDRRSPKVASLRHDPRVALVGYDTVHRTQLRMTGNGMLLEDGARRRAWDALSEHQLIDYRGALPPGTRLTVPHPDAALPEASVSPTSSADDGYDHFCVVDIQLDTLDWLDLSDKAHPRRAQFERRGDTWHGAWIAP